MFQVVCPSVRRPTCVRAEASSDRLAVDFEFSSALGVWVPPVCFPVKLKS